MNEKQMSDKQYNCIKWICDILDIDYNGTSSSYDAWKFIKDNKLGWWHWISNMWLLVDSSGQMTASILRDKICKLYSENRVMVIELDGDRDTWAGFGPTQPKNMFDWIKQNWGKD